MSDKAVKMREALEIYFFPDLCEIVIEYARSLGYYEKLACVLRFDSTTDEYETSRIQFDSNTGDESIVVEWRSGRCDSPGKKYSILERYNRRWQRKYEVEFTDLAHDVYSPLMRYSLATRGAYRPTYRDELKTLYFNRMCTLINKY